MADLPAARGLAHQLWGQCRESPSAYKLLSSSVKNLRNVLEELEELVLGPEDMNLETQITQSRDLLERLNLSLQSYQRSQVTEVDESAVADFKTSLDVIGQELTVAYDAMSMGEIPLQLDTAPISLLASPSSHWASTSASAVESGHEYHESTRTSSAYSMIAKANPWTQDESDEEHPLSDEKEAYGLGAPHAQNSASNEPAITTKPSVDFRFPFASPDLMSISIEEASTMILRDDDTRSSNLPDGRSKTSPHSSLGARSQAPASQSEPHVATGLGIVEDAEEADQANNQPESIRPRAASESAHPTQPKSSKGRIDPDLLKLYPTKSNDLIDRAALHRPTSVRGDASHLSPHATTPESVRRSRTTSGSSISFSTRSVETGEPTTYPNEESNSPHESYRKDLSVVFEGPVSETDEFVSSTSQPRPANSDSSPQQPNLAAEVTPLPPPPTRRPPSPPTRRPPSPPKQRRVPTIPKRSASYRIVNAAVSDQSSSDDDHEDELYSNSKPSSPTAPKHSLESQANENQYPRAHGDEQGMGFGAETRHQQRSGKEKSTHAQRVLMARAAYTPHSMPAGPPPNRSQTSAKPPAFTTKLSTPSLVARRHSEEDSSLLKRHSTSAALPRDRLVRPRTSGNEAPNSPSRCGRTETHPYSRFVSQYESVVPVIPPNPPPSIPQEDAAGVFEKELAPENGLEVDALESSEAPEVVADTETQSISNGGSISRSEYGDSLTGWYAPNNHDDTDNAEVTDLDAERINLIVHFWNSCAWDQAESYLNGYLESLVEEDRLDRARRVRHLLGVCASFKGQWAKAIPLFLSVLRAPITDISQVDDGDCAAAYWLGDAYTLLNQRDEALLAYCLAEHGSIFLDSVDTGLSDCIIAEQEAVQMGASKADFKLRWTQLSFSGNPFGPHSILDPQVINATAVTSLFEYQPRKPWKRATLSGNESFFDLDSNKSRSSSFLSLHKRFQPLSLTRYHRLRIVPAEFEPDTSWPMMYDPFFSMANVRRGRLLVYECDLLAVFNSNADAKIPKSMRMDCFTSPDLNWLIKTVRECLRMLEMEWSEVANVEGTWFIVRYSFIQSRIATTHYFSIGLFKQSLKFRSAYGVEICPDGICSARIIRTDLEHQKGVHNSEPKRIRKLIREYLDNAGKQQVKVK